VAQNRSTSMIALNRKSTVLSEDTSVLYLIEFPSCDGSNG
jgi:hypothetical protein